MLEIIQVFISASGPLVGFEMGQADEVDFDLVQNINRPYRITLFKAHPRNAGGNLNPEGWYAQADDLPFLEEECWREFGEIEAKRFEGSDHLSAF